MAVRSSEQNSTIYIMHKNIIIIVDVPLTLSPFASQFVQGNAALYVKYSVKLESQYPYVIALLLFFTILWMPFWQLIIIKFGKKTAFFVGMWILMLLNVSLLFADFYPYVVYPLVLLGAMGVSCNYLLPW